jgi:hypothetical protein
LVPERRPEVADPVPAVSVQVFVCLDRPVVMQYPDRAGQPGADLVRIVAEDAQPPGAPESLRARAPDGCRNESLRGAKRLCGAFGDLEDRAPVQARPAAGTR